MLCRTTTTVNVYKEHYSLKTHEFISTLQNKEIVYLQVKLSRMEPILYICEVNLYLMSIIVMSQVH